MIEFRDLGLSEAILRAVSNEGYTNPTPIQSQVIPAMLNGHDVIGIAQTGTGKTASFVLPLLHMLEEAGQRPSSKCCQALILTPTRELAGQIVDGIRTYGKFMRVTTTLIVGGAKPGPQIKAMARGVDIVVATPGRLLDHMNTGAVRLNETQAIVLDEADQMLDLGFMPAIREIVSKIPEPRQTVLLSATMPKPIRALAHDFMNKPKEIAVAQEAKPIERIAQSVRFIDQSSKRETLVDILRAREVTRAIVFTRTKRGADRVSQHLQKAGISAEALHGDKSQGQRDRILSRFRAGRAINVLVATDVAARGIDVDDVSHVVNYELPNIPEAYVHRIGRTARAGKSGIAISLCDRTERPLLRDIERLTGRPLDAVNDDGVLIPGEQRTDLGEGGSKAPGNKRARGGFKGRGGPRKANWSGNRSGSRNAPANRNGDRKPQRDSASGEGRDDRANANGAPKGKPRTDKPFRDKKRVEKVERSNRSEDGGVRRKQSPKPSSNRRAGEGASNSKPFRDRNRRPDAAGKRKGKAVAGGRG